eukprot:TRINITY_DN33490_c0_g2_i1.p1 TRINITY_DN33490_c0_g2~~TRINITY_DN33490_c0_g2_i1.p1  ORF type:complete len:483 (+),score=111.73 TRINITY_DN33490_c0_g2_i1:56-1504(+)
MSTPAAASMADKFEHMQLRSVLDDVGSEADETWERMIKHELCMSNIDVKIQLALPSSSEAEECLLRSVEQLAEALDGVEAFVKFYKSFGWSDPEAYFEHFGQSLVMIVDVDHNDSDDRLSIILLACQVASANAHRGDAAKTFTVFLDARTYETKSGLTMWRTLQLAARLNHVLAEYGVVVRPVFTDCKSILGLISEYLKVPAELSALEARVPGTAALLREDSSVSLPELLAGQKRVTVWLLGGICKKQVEDLKQCCQSGGTHFVLYEQAQPAWQSHEVPSPKDSASEELQPAWCFPPPNPEAAARGFGVEPSNVRSSEAPYSETLGTYLLLQQLVAWFPDAFSYVFPALARSDAYLPAPPGKPMKRICGRPFNVIPGTEYVIKKACNPERSLAAFSKLLQVVKPKFPTTLYEELCIGSSDDFGAERKELAAVVKYGTFMADAILVCLAARPPAQVGAQEAIRRLAQMRMLSGREDQCACSGM